MKLIIHRFYKSTEFVAARWWWPLGGGLRYGIYLNLRVAYVQEGIAED